MSLLPDRKTSLTAAMAYRDFQTVLLELGLDLATLRKACPVFLAQSALETAHWNACHCYNFGNARPGRGWTGDICQFRCNEVFNGKVVWFDPPAPGQPGYGDPLHGSSFRAFISELDGVRDYFQLIKNHWPEAYAAALNGDAASFVHGLKQRGYFTADEGAYRNAVVQLVSSFANVTAQPMYVMPPIDWEAMRLQRNAQSYLDTAWDRLDLTHTSDDYDPTADQ